MNSMWTTTGKKTHRISLKWLRLFVDRLPLHQNDAQTTGGGGGRGGHGRGGGSCHHQEQDLMIFSWVMHMK